MKNKFFIDTNILIYSVDKFDKTKQKKARALLKEIAANDAGVISTQVLQEFYVAATKKLNAAPLIVKEIINSFEKFEVVQITVEMIKDAIDVSLLNKISFWDALIIVSAEIAKCSALITEDLNSGQIIKGVKIINPLLV
jgi:predicted nucleic acid-binding protein